MFHVAVINRGVIEGAYADGAIHGESGATLDRIAGGLHDYS